MDTPVEQKSHLKDFQARLSERLREASTAPRSARLGLLIGDQRWLVDLAEAGEIVPLPSGITTVPLTRDWFRGLVNLRGSLFGVSDLLIAEEDHLVAVQGVADLLDRVLVQVVAQVDAADLGADVPRRRCDLQCSGAGGCFVYCGHGLCPYLLLFG